MADNQIRHFMELILKKIPLRIVDNLSDITPLVPFYHLVTNERVPHVYHLYKYKNEAQFISDIDFLCKRYQPTALADIIDNAMGKKRLKKGSFLLTFDDGYSQMFSVVAPILLKKGLPAVFFINTDFIDNQALSCSNKISLLIELIVNQEAASSRKWAKLPAFSTLPLQEALAKIRTIKYKEAKVLDEWAALLELDFHGYLMTSRPFLSTEQIQKMIEWGFDFGAHSVDHPHYVDLSLEAQLDQTISSLETLQNKFHLPYSVFAFPHNDQAVTRNFFKAIGDQVDLTFGTGGPRTDSIRSNLQRIDFEKTLESAKDILTYSLIKKIIYQWSGRSKILRV